MPLPHLRPEFHQDSEEPFETMEKEVAKRYRHTHPDYQDTDEYGNKATPMVPPPKSK